MADHSPVAIPRPVGLAPVSLAELAGELNGELAGEPGSKRISRIDPGGDHASSAAAVEVSGVTLISAAVRPGDLFAAVPGSVTHGATFAAQAVRAGAVAIVTDAAGLSMVRAAEGVAVPVLVAERPRAMVGHLAAHVYGHPSRAISVVGVTGTSGKTTTCFLLESALAAAGERVGLIGTVMTRINSEVLPSALTTPEAPDLQALFAVMAQRGVTSVAMEVSSHALAQGRVDGTSFAVGAFTNLSHDHLDYHGDMESYFAAKRLLFDGRARREVVVIDDDYGRRLAADRPLAMTVSAAGAPADWTARAAVGESGVQHLTIAGPEAVAIETQIALPGAFNVANAVTAVACAVAAGADPMVAARGLATVQVPGRMERVDVGQPFLAIVDYAHKPAALTAVLQAVRAHCSGRVLVVVGAGGDRDQTKRAMMGQAAATEANMVIVTDDNPRSENPGTIRAQILSGARSAAGGADVTEIGDRHDAINAAVQAARAGDAVVIAGKGHEHGQEIAGVVHPFSDRDQLIAALGGGDSGQEHV